MRNQINRMEEVLKRRIADNLKYYMKVRGYSQVQLANLSDIPQSTMSDIITGKFLVSEGRLERLATALKVSKSEIEPSYDVTLENILHLESMQVNDNVYFNGRKLSRLEKTKILKMLDLILDYQGEESISS